MYRFRYWALKKEKNKNKIFRNENTEVDTCSVVRLNIIKCE